MYQELGPAPISGLVLPLHNALPICGVFFATVDVNLSDWKEWFGCTRDGGCLCLGV